ncbi:tyrosine-type recombinase/integrase [Margalitia sp. FSL K6-0131]|uniref:tyrosine-type recombinase/integrase n=1 Tax=Margalitia sp. FSL K6-0131 TaxID=2954604 RepID=UPI0030FBD293
MISRVTKDKKTGTFYYTIEVGTKENRKRKVKKNFKTKREAKAALDLAIAELQKELANDKYKKDLFLGDYLDYWLKAYAKSNTAPNTYKGYERIILVHLKPGLGHIKLHELSPVQLQNYYLNKLDTLSAQSIKHLHRLLSKALNDAVDWEFVSKNVVPRAKPPKPKKFRPTFYSKEELDRLLEAAKSSTVYYPIIYSAGHTGARLGELRALQWTDINFDNRRMAITKTAYEDENFNVQIRDLTKGGKDRTIVIGKKLMNFLKSHYNRYQELKKSLGDGFNANDLVFFNSNGHYLNPQELHRAYKSAVKRAGLKDSRFHDTRHSHASILLEKNVHPKIVSERLGHSKIGITMDLYSHAIPSLQEQAVELFDEEDDNEQ